MSQIYTSNKTLCICTYIKNLNKKKYFVNHIREYNQFTREKTLRESVYSYAQFTQQEIISVNHVREYNQFTREKTLRESVHSYAQFTQQEIISVNHVREYNQFTRETILCESILLRSTYTVITFSNAAKTVSHFIAQIIYIVSNSTGYRAQPDPYQYPFSPSALTNDKPSLTLRRLNS
jgi:hypothetical protein